jgi:hypothetical protein
MDDFAPTAPHTPPVEVPGPLGLGELLDRAFRLYRAHFRTLTLTAALLLVPYALISGVLTGRVSSSYLQAFEDAAAASPDVSDEAALEMMASTLAVFGQAVLVSVLGVVLLGVATLALTRQSLDVLAGQVPAVETGLRAGLRRFLPFLGMTIVSAILMAGVTLVAMAPAFCAIVAMALAIPQPSSTGAETAGLVFGLVMIVVVLLTILLVFLPLTYFTARWAVALPGLVDQGWGPVEALRESWRLTRGQTLRVFGYVVLLGLLGFLVTALPPQVITTFASIAMPQLATSGVSSGLSTGLTAFLSIAWQPIHAAALVLLYFDLRVRQDALDIEQRIGRLETETAGT